MEHAFTTGRPDHESVITLANDLNLHPTVKALVPNDHGWGRSDMSSFHQPPRVSDVLTPERKAFIRTLGVNPDAIQSYWDLRDLLDMFVKSIGAAYPTSYSTKSRGKDRPVIVRAKLNTKCDPASSKILADLCGRVHVNLHVETKHWAMMVDKKGLAMFLPPEIVKENPDVAFAAALMCSDMCTQRMFTTDTSNKGHITDVTQKVVDTVAKLYPAEMAFAAAHVHPSYITNCTVEQATHLLALWFKVCIRLSYTLDSLWNGGVQDRIARHGCRVPSRRSDVNIDVNAWNSVCGAWNNAVRSIRTLLRHVGAGHSALVPLPCLIAGDVSEMFELEDDSDERVQILRKKVQVYAHLAGASIRPWTPFLDGTSDVQSVARALGAQYVYAVRPIVTAACANVDLDPNTLLGVCSTVKTKEKDHTHTLVCGIPVNPEHADALKAAGAFGANSWGNNPSDGWF